jgi:hypothetical protein
MLDKTDTFAAYSSLPFSSIVRFNAAGERVTEDDTGVVAEVVITFWPPAAEIEVKSAFAPFTVVRSIKDWDEGRDDEQKLAFLGELIRRLRDASIAGVAS